VMNSSAVMLALALIVALVMIVPVHARKR